MSKKTVKTYDKTGASGIMSLIQKPKPVQKEVKSEIWFKGCFNG